MCSALLPVTAVNDQSQLVLQSCFAFADLFKRRAISAAQRNRT